MATKYNFAMDSGTDFSLTLSVNTHATGDLSDYTAASKMKKYHLAPANTAVAFTCAINSTSNTISLTMAHSVSANLSPGRYVYDIKLTNSSNSMIRIYEGMITVNPEVT